MKGNSSAGQHRPKVLYIISTVYDGKEFEGLVEHWDRSRYELEFLLLNPVPDCEIQQYIRKAGYTCTTLPFRGKKDVPVLLWRVIQHLRRTRPHVVHCNLPEASMIGLLAARITGIPLAVYTRHHTLHNHKYHPKRGVFYDRIINRLAHRIIAITPGVREVLVKMENVPQEKVLLIHHGFELDAPSVPDPILSAAMRIKYHLGAPGDRPVIGVISRPFEWKGLDHVIAGFEQLLRDRPDALLMLFHWTAGGHSARYQEMLQHLPRGSWTTVEWERGIDEMYHVFDAFVHVPEDKLSEAFGFVYVEALKSGTPSVLTRSGILSELDGERLRGVYIVPYRDAAAIADRLRTILAAPASAVQRLSDATTNTAYMRGLIGVDIKMAALYALYGTAGA